MSDEGASLEDPKRKSSHSANGEKRRRELEAKGEPTQRYAGAFGSISNTDKPSKECKAAVFQTLYKWFKNTLFMHINNYFWLWGMSLERRHSRATCARYLRMRIPETSGRRTN
jgi:hypothetical protein